jgi:cytidylate kinase
MAEPPEGAARLHSIALDGPAAAGKTTVGQRLAGRLGMLCFDTGLLYRALTVAALRAGVSTEDGDALAALAAGDAVKIRPRADIPGGCTVLVGKLDVTADLRRPEVDAAVSAVSRQPAVRAALLAAQRRIATEQPVVMLGRDIGTVVLPDADLKIYLDASAGARARRRFRERLRQGEAVVFGEVLAQVLARDAQDSQRATAPLRAAPDAVRVNTDRCDAEAVAEHLFRLALRWPDPALRAGLALPCEPEAAA